MSDLAIYGSSVNMLIILYVILCCIIKKPVFLLAFFIPEAMVNLSFFDVLKDWHLNAIELVVYSYVFTYCKSVKSKFGCAMIMVLAIILCYDSYFYGVGGVHGEVKTIVYNNIGSSSLFVHVFFIAALLPITRIRKRLLDFTDYVMRISHNSAYMLSLCYNTIKQTFKNKITWLKYHLANY